MKNKICFIAITITNIIFISYFIIIILFNNNKNIMTIKRDSISNNHIILNESIPLGINDNENICMSIFNFINQYRTANGKNTLSWSTDLESCAKIRAKEASQLWSHTRPNGSQWYTVNESIMFGENLAKGYDTANDVVIAWEQSPAHNENLLWNDFKYVGIAEYNGYYACEFCY